MEYTCNILRFLQRSIFYLIQDGYIPQAVPWGSPNNPKQVLFAHNRPAKWVEFKTPGALREEPGKNHYEVEGAILS